MPDRRTLKKRLKASDRRRKRRTEQSANSPLADSTSDHAVQSGTQTPNKIDGDSPTEQNSVDQSDIVGQLVALVLKQTETSDVCDSQVIAAIRAQCEGASTSDPIAVQLSQNIQQLRERTPCRGATFQNALRELLRLAKHHRNESEPMAFVRYLAIVAS